MQGQANLGKAEFFSSRIRRHPVRIPDHALFALLALRQRLCLRFTPVTSLARRRNSFTIRVYPRLSAGICGLNFKAWANRPSRLFALFSGVRLC
jgi:hypothetical protein